jgi:hypothetical protein
MQESMQRVDQLALVNINGLIENKKKNCFLTFFITKGALIIISIKAVICKYSKGIYLYITPLY